MPSKSIRKNGFTLAETLLVCSIFAIMVVGIILAVNRSYTFMNNTKLQIQATNLAREGVEMMFNIRDTNWRKCSGKKDDFRLYLGTGSDETNCTTGLNRTFTRGIYSINEGINTQGDRYVYAKSLNITNEDDINKFYDNDGFWNNTSKYPLAKISFSGSYYYRSGGKHEGNIKDLLGGVDFYRIVRVYGIYCKAVDGESNVLFNGESSQCSKASDPKELRFCVKVFYRNHGDPHSSELCSIMTNFEE